MGSGRSRTVTVDNPELLNQIKQLTGNYNKLQAQFETFMSRTNEEIERLRKEAMKEELGYMTVRKFLADFNKQVEVTDRVAMIGDKGSGKSTFLWLKGEGPKPEDTCNEDGTTEIQRQGKYSVDTIGVKMDMNSLLKLLTVLIDVGVPNTFVLFSNNRIGQDLLLLAHFMIRDLYICPMIPNHVYEEDDPLDADNAEKFYNQKKLRDGKQAGLRVITHLDPIVPINGNVAAVAALFPGGHLSIVEWSEFKENPSSLDVIRFKIAKLFWLFKTKYNSDQRRFLNSFDD
ncbi:hypothetical protein EON65_33150 [archaeon]|nr:MAG: hypothetical protein EON65_33150 [archaeon]